MDVKVQCGFQSRENINSRKQSHTAYKVWWTFPVMDCHRRAAASHVAEFYKWLSKFQSVSTLGGSNIITEVIKSHMLPSGFRRMENISFLPTKGKGKKEKKSILKGTFTSRNFRLTEAKPQIINQPENCWHGNFCVTVAKNSWWILG